MADRLVTVAKEKRRRATVDQHWMTRIDDFMRRTRGRAGCAVTAGVFHREAASGRWLELSLMEQLGNVGTEVARAARAMEAGNEARAWNALTRALELFDLTIADERWRGPKRREICRAREVVCDFIVGDNEYGSSLESLDSYFIQFAMATRRRVQTDVSDLTMPTAIES